MIKHLTVAAFLLVFGLASVATAEDATIKSDNALAYLTIDIENTPGWVAKIKGGYQWKLFRSVGLDVDDTVAGAVSHSGNHTKGGAAGSVSLGYNFGRFPLTLGLQFGLGPSGQMSERTAFADGRYLYSHQNVKIYTLDLTADYDFRNCSRWTPFVGVTAGAAFINQRGHAEFTNAAGLHTGSMGQRKRVNFMTGARAGVKYDINSCVTLSLYGSYNYLGKVPSKSYLLSNAGVPSYEARTKKITAHAIDVKAGLRISF